MGELGTRIKLAAPQFFAGVALVISVLTVLELLQKLVKEPVWVTVAALAYLVVITGALYVYCIYRIVQTIKKERYANVTVQIHEIQHNIRNLITYMVEQESGVLNGSYSFELFREKTTEKFISILDSIAHLFSMITGTTCRACIKTVFIRDSIPYLQTFARDRRSFELNFDRDEKRRKTRHDPLQANSEFSRMMNVQNGVDGDWHFFCNNLERNDQFRSTSLIAYDPNYAQASYRPTFFERLRDDRWKLPYRSTVCSAIGQAPTRDIIGPQLIVVGFLAVDSESRDVFSKRWDLELVFAFADALFHPLDRYLRAFNSASGSVT